MLTKISKLVMILAKDTASPQANFDLALEYEMLGQTAAAIGFYLRAAEYGYKEEPIITYTSLIKIGICLENQDGRDFSASNSYLQAIAYLPERPEAFYFLAKFYERHQNWQEAYTNYTLGLKNVNVTALNTETGYLGKEGFLCGKAVAGYNVGRVNESKNIISSLASENSGLSGRMLSLASRIGILS